MNRVLKPNPKEIVPACFAREGTKRVRKAVSDQWNVLRPISAVNVWKAIEEHATDTPVDFISLAGGWNLVFVKAWNWCCKVLALIWKGALDLLQVSSAVVELLKKLGFDESKAQEVAESLMN